MRLPRFIGFLIVLLAICPSSRADTYVVVVANARPDYIKARMGEDGKLRTETYVVMQGRFFEGMVRDTSIERMDIREIAGRLAPELARRQYLPASDPAKADLLLVVHWGTTIPQVGLHEMLAKPTQELDHDRLLYEKMQSFLPAGESMNSDIPGAFLDLPPEYRPKFGQDSHTATGFTQLEEFAYETSQQLRRSDNASLLGYNAALHREGKRIWSSDDERSMRYDLNMERYFIIIRAYELNKSAPSSSRKTPVWTMHLNISAPGNNFKTALTRMGEGVSRFAGQGAGSLATFRAGKAKIGTVKIGELIILGEENPK